MNAKDLALGGFVVLSVALASLTLSEYSQVGRLNSELSQSRGASASTTLVTLTATTTVICPRNSICPDFTFAPSSPLRVELVQATNETAGGEAYVGFYVLFDNIGNSSVYIPAGSNGVAVSVPADSPVLVSLPYPRCPGDFIIQKLNPGQSYSLLGPDCGSGVRYVIAQAGSIQVSFDFNWTGNASSPDGPFSNSTTISAQFDFP